MAVFLFEVESVRLAVSKDVDVWTLLCDDLVEFKLNELLLAIFILIDFFENFALSKLKL